jgi:hypothetical protein
MNKLVINKTTKTPYISLEKGLFQFTGRSIVEDSKKTFKPAADWIKSFKYERDVQTSVVFNFDYLNTSSAKSVLDILKILDEQYANGYDIVISWYYEEGDNDMLDLGVHLKSFVKVPFNFIEYESYGTSENFTG